MIYASKYNKFTYKMADQEFEILVSTADFLQLQSRCQTLEMELKNLTQERSQLNIQMFEITQQNASMQKKITRLEDNIVYLSKQSIKLAQGLIDRPSNEQNIKKMEKQSAEVTASIKKQYYQQVESLNILFEQQRQKSNSLAKQLENIQSRFALQKNKTQQLSECLKSNLKQIEKLTADNSKIRSENTQHLSQIETLTNRINKLIKEFQQNSNMNGYITDQISNKLKLQQATEELESYKDRCRGQDYEIKSLEARLKQLQSVSKKMEGSKQKGKSKKKDVALQEIKSLVESYFLMFTFGLIESGGLSKQQINGILKAEEEVIIRFIRDAVQASINKQVSKSQRKEQNKKH